MKVVEAQREAHAGAAAAATRAGAAARAALRALLADAGVAATLASLAPLAVVAARGAPLRALERAAGEAVARFAVDFATSEGGRELADAAARDLAATPAAEAWVLLFARGGEADARRVAGVAAATAVAGAAPFHGLAARTWPGAALAAGPLTDVVAERLGPWFSAASLVAVVALRPSGLPAPVLRRGLSSPGADPHLPLAWLDDDTTTQDWADPSAGMASPLAATAALGAPPPRALVCDEAAPPAAPPAALDRALELAGFEVRRAAPAALDAEATAFAPDLLVACIEARAARDAVGAWAAANPHARHLPVLAVARCAHEDVRRRALDAGAGAFCALPAAAGELARVANVLLAATPAAASAASAARESHTELLRADRLATLGWLAASVGHDLRTPLAAIRSNADLALRALERLAREPAAREPGVARTLATLSALEQTNLAAVDRLVEIVAGLKAFARGDDAAPRGAALPAVVEQALLLCAHELRQVCLRRLVPEELPPVAARPVETMQLVMNLLVNAAHAAGPGGTIELRAEAAPGEVVLTVSDDGPGIDPAVRDRLFRAGVTTKRARGGSGLGLAIVKRIVDAAGGRVEVASGEGGTGATFRVVLPRADGAADGAAS